MLACAEQEDFGKQATGSRRTSVRFWRVGLNAEWDPVSSPTEGAPKAPGAFAVVVPAWCQLRTTRPKLTARPLREVTQTTYYSQHFRTRADRTE
jgi:hypothetical protein